MLGVSPHRRLLAASLVAALMVSTGSCATNPVTGQRQVSFFGTSSEIEMGREYDVDLVQILGLYDDPELNAYVDAIGQRMAAASERPQLPWTFRVIDDPVVNAFALPGGFVYVTRGILAHMGSEAELAGVLGHEIGHVTARHGIHRLSKQLLTAVTVGVGLALVGADELWDLALAAMSLAFLKHSRDDERQADELGLRYLWDAGYEPGAMVELFGTLARAGGDGEGGRIPTWLSTHPDSERRGSRIASRIADRGGAPPDAARNLPEYLERLDGMSFGEDPRRGYTHGGLFVHPAWEVSVRLPQGWGVETSARDATLTAPEGKAAVVLALEDKETPRAAMAALAEIDDLKITGERQVRSEGLDTLQAALELEVEGGTLRGLVAFTRHRQRTLRVLAIAEDRRWGQSGRLLEGIVESLAPVVDRALLEVEPARIERLWVHQPTTLEALLHEHSASVELSVLARINAIEPGQVLEAGRWLKWVVGGRRPGLESAPGAVGP